MRALVGQFAPDARWYRARPVDLEGQPSWTLGQMHAMWLRKFRKDTAAMVAELLGRDWSLLANSAWPPHLLSDEPNLWAYVNGVGRAHRERVTGRALVGQMPAERPAEGDRWAYLWEHQLGALHVYLAKHGQWHHLATLSADVWAELSTELVLEIQARRAWVRSAA